MNSPAKAGHRKEIIRIPVEIISVTRDIGMLESGFRQIYQRGSAFESGENIGLV